MESVSVRVKSLFYIFSGSFSSAVDDEGANEPARLGDDKKWPCVI